MRYTFQVTVDLEADSPDEAYNILYERLEGVDGVGKVVDLKSEADIVRRACVKAYNMDYDQYLKCLGVTDSSYHQNKFKVMQRDFSQWYCQLDSENQEKFMRGV